MITIFTEWSIMEEGEPFGFHDFDHEPKIGEIVQLKWLDAGKVKIIHIQRSTWTLYVEKV